MTDVVSDAQVKQLLAEYQQAIDVRSHYTPVGRIDRIKHRCEETVAALRELQRRRVEPETVGPAFTAENVRQMLFAYMGANDMTQAALAKMIGVSAPHLNGMLHGVKAPGGRVLRWLKLNRVIAYRRAQAQEAKRD